MKTFSLPVVQSCDLRDFAFVTKILSRLRATATLVMICLERGTGVRIADEGVQDALAMGSS